MKNLDLIQKRTLVGALIHIREERGLSQRQLSKLAGVHYTTIAKVESENWENASYRPDVLQKIVNAMNVSEEELNRAKQTAKETLPWALS